MVERIVVCILNTQVRTQKKVASEQSTAGGKGASKWISVMNSPNRENRKYKNSGAGVRHLNLKTAPN